MSELMIAQEPAIKFNPAEITFDEVNVRNKIESRIEPYVGTTPEEVANMDIKDAKKARADLNAIKKEINDARIAVKREYNKPLTVFEQSVRDIESLITEPLKVLDDGIKKREENEKAERYEQLQQLYMEMTPALAEAVPFDKFLEKSWLTATGFKKGMKALEQKLIEVTNQLEILENTDIKYKVESRRKFLETLSLTEAIAYDAKLREEDEAAARMDAMRAECMAANTPEPEPEPEPEPIVDEAEDAPVQPEPAPQKAPEPEPVAYEPIFSFDEEPCDGHELSSIRVMGDAALVQQVADYALSLGLQVM